MVASNNLLTVEIILPQYNLEFPAEALDIALALPAFRNLRSFSLHGATYRSLLTAEVRARMPLANAREILG
jgi:hypothetical protein